MLRVCYDGQVMSGKLESNWQSTHQSIALQMVSFQQLPIQFP
jgi:hypothetical protein